MHQCWHQHQCLTLESLTIVQPHQTWLTWPRRVARNRQPVQRAVYTKLGHEQKTDVEVKWFRCWIHKSDQLENDNPQNTQVHRLQCASATLWHWDRRPGVLDLPPGRWPPTSLLGVHHPLLDLQPLPRPHLQVCRYSLLVKEGWLEESLPPHSICHTS